MLGLRDPPLLEPAREELNDLLGDVVRQRRMAIGNTQYATQSFDIAFEGARADEGYAALETVSLKLQQLKALLVRIGEWKQGLQFRIAGSPSRSFEQLIVPLMG